MSNTNIVNCGPRLDRLPNNRWHYQIFAMIAFGLLVCWSNAIGGLVLAQLAEIGWTNNDISAIFSSLTTAGMFLGALLGGIIGDKIGRKKSILLFELIHIVSMLLGACSPNMTYLIVFICLLDLQNICLEETEVCGQAEFHLLVIGLILYVQQLLYLYLRFSLLI